MNPMIVYTKWLLKWLGITILSLIAIAVLGAGGVWAWQWWSHDRHAANIDIVVKHKNQWSNDPSVEPAPTKLVGGTASPCPEDSHPVFVGIVNRSSKTIDYISIRVSAHLPDYSTNILPYSSDANMDRIVPPTGGFGQCWMFNFSSEYKNNPETKAALYEGILNFVRFRD